MHGYHHTVYPHDIYRHTTIPLYSTENFSPKATWIFSHLKFFMFERLNPVMTIVLARRKKNLPLHAFKFSGEGGQRMKWSQGVDSQ
jgi:hypothetical protein